MSIEARRRRLECGFGGLGDREAMRRLLDAATPDHRDRTRRVAEAVLAGRIEFFGDVFGYDGAPDWHLDPVTRRTWPLAYHRDEPLHGPRAPGDVKYVWELSRHQFLIDLGKHAYVSECERAAAHARALVRDWLARNPYGFGVNWACALEPAFRAWSWIWTYLLTAEIPGLDDDTHARWLAGFADHGSFLFRHLEFFESPYNHLIGEASALYALGVLFPEFSEADVWRARGRAVLDEHLREQFYADGMTVEQSAFYHHATLGFYLLSMLLANRRGEPFDRHVTDAIERALHVSMVLTQPDGRIPQIGGADDGKPIRFEQLPFWDFRPYLAIGAVLFGRADFKCVAGRFWEDAAWLLGPSGYEAFERLPARTPAERCAVLPVAGYATLRTDWTPASDFVCFDGGPQAGGLHQTDVPSAAHGHADCLSVVVTLGGERVLVDSGFYCYNGPPEWEVHFRKTAAHSTVSVAGLDQAHHVSKMAWTRTYSARLERVEADGVQAVVVGSHDGFVRQGVDVTHRRTLWQRPDHYVVVLDELLGEPGHSAAVVWQFAPGQLVLASPGAWYDDWCEIGWHGNFALDVSTACGGALPSDGWVAPSLGVRVPAPRLRLNGRLDERRSSLVTVLARSRRTAPRLQRWREGDDAAIGVSVGGGVDWIVAPGTASGRGPVTAGERLLIHEVRTDAPPRTVDVAGGWGQILHAEPQIP
ncbi:MAG: alginate lyase family protein [Vicinamibacterales bacterium]